MPRSYLGIFVAILAGVVVAAAAADTVVLKNGDRITGKTVVLKGGSVTVETENMGTVTIDAAQVISIQTSDAVGVESTDGTRLVGKLSLQEGASAVVDTPSGRLSIPAANVKEIGPAIPEAPAWHGSAELGIVGQTGNKEMFTGNTAANINRQSGGVTLLGSLLVLYGQTDGVVSTNQQRLSGRIESEITKKYFLYGALELERDEFKDLALRTTATVGLGRTWWKEGDNFWKTGAGVGVTNEAFESGGSRTFPVAELISEYSKEIRKGMLFTDTARLVPDLSYIPGWRAENTAGLSFALNSKGDLRLKLSVLNQYDNKPQSGVERLDTYYILSVMKTF